MLLQTSGRVWAAVRGPAAAKAATPVYVALAQLRREALARGWSELPPWIFCSEAGGLLDERDVQRGWYAIRRRAHKRGVRPLKLHTARHTYATLALASGKSLAWVAKHSGTVRRT